MAASSSTSTDATPRRHDDATSRGKVRVKRLPWPFSTGLWTSTAPPCASMMPFASPTRGQCSDPVRYRSRGPALWRICQRRAARRLARCPGHCRSRVAPRSARRGPRPRRRRSPWAYGPRRCHDISDRLLNQSGIGADERHLRRQPDSNGLGRAAATRGARPSFRRSPHIHPIAVEFQGAGSILVTDSKLRTISSRPSASVLIWLSKSFCAAGGSLLP